MLNIDIPYDLFILLLGIYRRELKFIFIFKGHKGPEEMKGHENDEYVYNLDCGDGFMGI